ncbi:MAG: SUMF1/EgtB/PvdO family nonheme iron enzyme [Treponema sp.]|nr:SUMF1/EgtB/PvdO family nonheme iron enzyme [Treponema sp.]
MEKCYEKLIYQKITFKNGYTGGASFCIVILFAACKNFLNAKETKSQIDAAIAYANSSEYTIYIKYSGKNGVVKSPAGSEISKKVTDTFTLSFDPIGDYEFVSWKITNDTTNEELPNGEYLKIEDVLNSETKCTFVKAPEPDMKLCLSPVVTERPQILSYAPMLGTEMSFKDSAIQVVFDYPMDTDSIYYTDEELADLMAELGIADKNDSSLLKTTITQNETEQIKYYGYKKDGITYFKNICITASETGESLTGFFKAPVFLTEDKLIVKVNDYNSLPDYGEIKVEIAKDFFYTLNGKPITMAGSRKWIYQINENRDNVGPVINKIEVKCGDKTLVVKDPYTESNLPTTTVKQLTFSNSKNVPFAFNVRARDTGNGLGSRFYVYYKKVYDSYYKKVSYSQVSYFSIPFQSMTSYDASFNGNYTEVLGNGVYELTFCFEDSLGNRTYYPDDKWKANSSTSWTKSYVISVDTTGPANDTKILIFNGNRVYFTISESADYPDMDKYCLLYKTVNQEAYTSSQKINLNNLYGEKTFSINNDENQDSEISFKLIDFIGNEKVSNYKKKIPSKQKMGSDIFFPGVSVSSGRDLLVSNHEVTQKEYGQYMTWYGDQNSESDLAPSDTLGKGDNFPAYYVNWYEAIMYCNLRSMAEGLQPVYYIRSDNNKIYDIAGWAQIGGTNIASTGEGNNIRYFYNGPSASTSNSALDIDYDFNANGYRLPTREEWVYFAKRANLDNLDYAGTNSSVSLKNYAWFADNAESKTHEVMLKTPNGDNMLYDMCGNVSEWTGSSTGNDRYTKGGSYKSDKIGCKITGTSWCEPLKRIPNIGFRVVRRFIPD